ncbi:TIM23 complex component [Mortierella claussenii]|nr:TIM23 complex component [Mortierella claussenii]
MATAVLTFSYLAAGTRSIVSSATARSALLHSAKSGGVRAPYLSLDRTAFATSVPRRWATNNAASTPPRPTTSSSGNPPPLSSKSTAGAQSPATKAGDAAKEQAARLQQKQQGSKNPVSSSNAATSRTTSTSTFSLGEDGTMDWNSYFTLRRTRRNYERALMVPCALAGTLGAGYYFAQRDFDPTPIFGMDQIIVYGLGTVAAGVIGLAVGPVVGNMVFRARHSKAKPLVDSMDKEFRKHIVKNRADPRTNSVTSPLPDFEGEKIKSVSDYRKWLRKQREHRRKTTFYV